MDNLIRGVAVIADGKWSDHGRPRAIPMLFESSYL